MARRHTREIEVDLQDFSDEEIAQEVDLRGLGTLVKADASGLPEEARQLVGDVQNLLCAKRYVTATVRMTQLLKQLLPAELFAAHEAMDDGRYDDAICRLDAFLHPSPAARAKELPKAQETRA